MKKDSYFKFKRERIIHSFLLSFGGNIHDLLQECNTAIREIDPNKEIGLRALEKHIKELTEDHGYPIEKYRPSNEDLISKNYGSNIVDYPHKRVDVRKVKFLRYSKPFKIPLKIRPDEYQKIDEAFIILKRFMGQKGWEWLDYLYEEGRDSLDLNTLLEQKISFEEDFSGMLKYFSIIKDATVNNTVLKVFRKIYQGRKEIHVELEFHPAFMKLWRNKWYAFGFGITNTKSRTPYILPIDKNIEKIEYSKNISFRKININFRGEPFSTYYFKDIIGVTNDQNKIAEEIVLRFHSKEKFRRLDSKPPHTSWQVIREHENHIDVKLNVKVNPELWNLIYEFSPGLEVLKPISLRNKVKNDLESGLNNYANL